MACRRLMLALALVVALVGVAEASRELLGANDAAFVLIYCSSLSLHLTICMSTWQRPNHRDPLPSCIVVIALDQLGYCAQAHILMSSAEASQAAREHSAVMAHGPTSSEPS
jgi:hypothetical protein